MSKGGRPPKYAEGSVGRLSLYIPLTTREQLEKLAYEDSKPGHMSNLSSVIIRLVGEEMDRRETAEKRTDGLNNETTMRAIEAARELLGISEDDERRDHIKNYEVMTLAKSIVDHMDEKPSKDSFLDVGEETFVYFIQNTVTKRIKIGITNNVKKRLETLRTAAGAEIALLGAFKTFSRKRAFDHEYYLHQHFDKYRIRVNGRPSEWFDEAIKPYVLKILEART